jgi:hypothetical protein
VPRALAWTLDLVLRALVVVAVLMVAAYLGRAGVGLALLTLFVVEWLAPAWFEVYWRGQTPGKRALGIAVVNDDGTPVRWGPALTRNLLRAVDFLPFLYGFGLAAAAAIGRLPQRATAPLPAYEIVCGLLLLAIPMMGIALGAVAGGFTPRYGLVVVAGLAVVAPIAAWRATRGVIRVDLAVALTMVIAFGGTVRYAWSSERPPFQHPYETRPALGAELEAGRAVAVTGGLTFAQLWYYAPPALRPSLFFVADPESARRQSGSDTIDTGLIALSHWAPVNVLGYREFLDAHREFSVYAFGSGWLIARLEADDIPLVAEVSGDPGARLLRAIGR